MAYPLSMAYLLATMGLLVGVWVICACLVELLFPDEIGGE